MTESGMRERERYHRGPGVATVNVGDLIDRGTFGAFQLRVVLLCVLVAVFDGLDVQVIGLAAPAIGRELHLDRAALGPAFSAASLGLMLGALGLGTLADRFGRKWILIASISAFGVFTLGTGFCNSLRALVLFRFLTGLGMGGAMPCFISLGSEYAPKARRVLVTSLLWAGFPLGGTVGGLLAAQFLEALGWRWLFYIGGIAPLVLVPFLAALLPESLSFLVATKADEKRITPLIALVNRDVVVVPGSVFVMNEKSVDRRSVVSLFQQGRGFGSAMLWVGYFMTFLLLITDVTWTPTLLHGLGMDLRHVALIFAETNLGAVVGTALAGFLVGRSDAWRVLPALFLGAALVIAPTGYAAPSVLPVTILQCLTGFLLGAGSSGLIAFAAAFYPTTIRSTGVGWAMGMGRFGSFVGPLAVGGLVGLGWSIHATILAMAVPALCAALSTATIAVRKSERGGGNTDTPFPSPMAVRARD
jgi:MFS transporter, AAHS family, 4-hydroxybenzoate transporter